MHSAWHVGGGRISVSRLHLMLVHLGCAATPARFAVLTTTLCVHAEPTTRLLCPHRLHIRYTDYVKIRHRFLCRSGSSGKIIYRSGTGSIYVAMSIARLLLGGREPLPPLALLIK